MYSSTSYKPVSPSNYGTLTDSINGTYFKKRGDTVPYYESACNDFVTKFVNPCLQLNGITTVLRIEHRVLILPTHLLAFLGCNYIFSLKVRFRLNAFQRGILYSAPEVLWPPLHWLITRSIPPRSNSSRSNSYQNRIEFSCRIGWHFLATCIMIARLKLMSHPK